MNEEVAELLAKIERLNRIGIELSSEADIDHVLEHILLGAKELTHSDAGTIYLIDKGKVVFRALRNSSLHIAKGGTTGVDIDINPIELTHVDGEPNLQNVVAYAVINRKTVNIEDVYTIDGFDFAGTRAMDELLGYRSKSFLTVPMLNHENEVIGVLQLINALDKEQRVRPFTNTDQSLAESLASQAAVTLTKKSLIEAQKRLFEAFIQLVAKAIDEKNPHTSAHCERVPELTLLLAEAAHASSAPAFATFSLSDSEFYEIKIASWLHDCGKITTPEHIINKATKLETIYDRIHAVNTRFDVIRRDLYIERLEGKISAPEHEQLIAELNADQEFINRTNTGGEFLPDEDKAKLADIGEKHQWSDSQGTRQPLLTKEEIYNLQISRGTITAEERDIMNNHMKVTIEMLEALPYPKALAKVPEIAGGHHERMDGKGFPKGLKRDEMSLPARMMGIADIFEALTASDRPYKAGKTLTESLTILGRMKEDQHIDPDLFDLFIRDQVYLKYAQRFLKPEQIDEVELSKIPGYSP